MVMCPVSRAQAHAHAHANDHVNDHVNAHPYSRDAHVLDLLISPRALAMLEQVAKEAMRQNG
jgi:hypothetical protein